PVAPPGPAPAPRAPQTPLPPSSHPPGPYPPPPPPCPPRPSCHPRPHRKPPRSTRDPPPATTTDSCMNAWTSSPAPSFETNCFLAMAATRPPKTFPRELLLRGLDYRPRHKDSVKARTSVSAPRIPLSLLINCARVKLCPVFL